ncbi:GntR family transcriptional regulator [Psychromicrobium lacuslunae]|uniref:GntR family transcriptional regulator n=1 Tax=Psychromicrobium lacuslunae TaxID=1618207 RepID=A0A0D4C006_9MICC|nr:GntR family transcriptional regulator [Psychromicrobium lacuslunae]AJT41735.1 GntR family transcriptional regulator [Psychromicrobium lacuslunae]
MTTPLHQRLSEELRDRIRNGDWPEGSAVPSEAALCQEFGISRGPVRQALATLRAEALITGGRGRQPIVRASTPAQSFSTFMSFTEWAQSMKMRPGQKTLEVSRRPAPSDVAVKLGITEGDSIVSVSRLRLLDDEPTMLELSYFVLEVGRLLFDFDTDSGSIFHHLRNSGVDLYSGHHVIDAVAASNHDAQHLGIDEGSPLLRERRITSSSTGQPLEYAEDRYRPELASFAVDNTLPQRTALNRVSLDGRTAQG